MYREKLLIKDNNDIIEISYDDILKYHGNEMMGGVALAFKIMLMAFPKFDNGLPKRGNFRFYSGVGKNGKGIIDALEMVTRVKTYNNLNLDIDYCKKYYEHLIGVSEIAPNGGMYYFEIEYKNCNSINIIRLCLKKNIISEKFIYYSKLCHNKKIYDNEYKILLGLRRQLAKSILNSDIYDLFHIF